MPFRNFAGAEYFVFNTLADASVPHGIFTRQGGASPPPWAGLNAGARVGDDPARVAANLARAAAALALPPEGMALVEQVHGEAVFPVVRVPSRTAPLPVADGMVTRLSGVALTMKFADCVPILLFDPVQRAAGIAHAGWRGTVKRVAARAVSALAEQFGSQPGRLLAGIGPSICAAHYEVGEEVLEAAQAAGLGGAIHGRHFDLWAANRLALEEAGVRQVEVAGECTVEDARRWFSHRGEGGRTGRFAALIAVPAAEAG
jgi:hypothetical protein